MEDIEDILFNNDNMEQYTDKEDIILPVLEKCITFIIEQEEKNTDHYALFYDKIKKTFTKYLDSLLRERKMMIRKNILLYFYRKWVQEEKIQNKEMLCILLMKKPANDISGINQVTILTSPYPDGQTFSCKHDCFYCPNEPAHEENNWTPQPRSYLFKEPAVMRANRNNFDPYLQTKNRLDSLFICGHKCDKLEFILEGGTFTEYPKTYLYNFFCRFIYCVNTYFDHFDNKKKHRAMLSLSEEIDLNKHATCKIIGICIETRPDAILVNDDDGIPWLKTLLSWGVTRIQIGVQQIDDFILKKLNRGHTIAEVIKAVEVMKNNCFKIDMHFMPDLPYSSPEKDKYMFDVVFNSDKFRADQLKIYPCEVVPWTKIKTWYEEGSYKPYGENKALIQDVLDYGLKQCNPWIRVSRMVRDIPDTYIQGGMKCGNMRQHVNDNLKQKNERTGDIRFREIGRHPQYSLDDAELTIRKYEASNGYEYFISFETSNNEALYGFIRLRIPFHNRVTNKKDKYGFSYEEFDPMIMFPETMDNAGLVRELHVYGGLHKVDCKNNVKSYQHKGFGTKLLKEAEKICLKHNKSKIVVISGIGVRHYYEKKGYTLQNNYMVKQFDLQIIIREYIYNNFLTKIGTYNIYNVLSDNLISIIILMVVYVYYNHHSTNPDILL